MEGRSSANEAEDHTEFNGNAQRRPLDTRLGFHLRLARRGSHRTVPRGDGEHVSEYVPSGGTARVSTKGFVPASGGQYHWCAMLASPNHKAFLSWLCGWIATLGWVANTAAGAFFSATMIQGILVQNDPDYGYQRWQGTLLIWAIVLIAFLVNSVGTKLLSVAEGLILILHLSAFLAVLIPLVYFSPHGSAKEVFATFTSNAGWVSDGLSWFIGFSLSANLPLIGYDGREYTKSHEHHRRDNSGC